MQDAVWMTLGQTLACQNPDEIVLLLKSSDRVAHDICHAAEGDLGISSAAPSEGAAGEAPGSSSSGGQAGGRHVLALRRWHDLRPEREFRCFVKGHELVGESLLLVSLWCTLLPTRQDLLQCPESLRCSMPVWGVPLRPFPSSLAAVCF